MISTCKPISTLSLHRMLPLLILAVSLGLTPSAVFAQSDPPTNQKIKEAVKAQENADKKGAPDKPVDRGPITPSKELLTPPPGSAKIPVVPAQAVPPLPKGPDAESLPPGQRPQDIPDSQAPTNNRPDDLQPTAPTVTGKDATITPTVPPATELPKTEALEFLIKQGVMPADALQRTALTRAQLANMIVYSVGYDITAFSEFPFYRDVPATHWAYRPIEIAREKQLLDYPDDHGFYKPEEPVTYGELYQAIGKVLTIRLQSEDAARQIVNSFADGQSVSSDLVMPVAKMSKTYFFPNSPADRKQLSLKPRSEVSPVEAAPFLVRLMQITGTHPTDGLASSAGVVAVLPAGLKMSIKPATAILKSQLAVGVVTNFVLTSDAGPLPKDSRIKGRVISVADGTYHIAIFNVTSPDREHSYALNTALDITFPENDETAYIDPAHVFEIQNNAPVAVVDKKAASSGAAAISGVHVSPLTRIKNVVTSPVHLIKSGVETLKDGVQNLRDRGEPAEEESAPEN